MATRFTDRPGFTISDGAYVSSTPTVLGDAWDQLAYKLNID